MRQKQVADDHSHWWDQTKWAFDLVMSPHTTPADLQMAGRTLLRQVDALDLPDGDLAVALEMAERASSRLDSLGITQPAPYDEGPVRRKK